jgi:hypothetical protein
MHRACGEIDPACIFDFFAKHGRFAYDFHFLIFENFIGHAVSMTPHDFKKFEYLCEFEFIFEKVLAPLLVAKV